MKGDLIAGTEYWQERDWTRAAQTARDNQALQKVFADFIAEQTAASIDAEQVADREAARLRVVTARLIQSELEAMATKPVKQ